jgi:ATP-binding cassette subfamily B protein
MRSHRASAVQARADATHTPANVSNGSQRSRAPGRPATIQTRRAAGVAGVIRDGLVAVGPARGQLWVFCVVAVVAAVVETALLYVVARLATSISATSSTVAMDVGPLSLDATVGQAVIAGAVLLVAVVVLSFPLSRLSARISARTLTRSRQRIVVSYLSSSWSYRSKEPEGHLQTLLGEYSQRSERVVQQMSTIVVSLTGLAILGVGALLIAPLATLIGSAAFVLLALSFRPLSHRVKGAAIEYATVNKDVLSHVAQTARLGHEIESFEVAEAVEHELEKDISAASGALERVRYTTRLVPMIYQAAALGLILAAIAVLNGVGGDALLALGPLVLLLVRALGYLKQLQVAVQTGQELTPYIQELEKELDEYAVHTSPSGSRVLSEVSEMRLSNVSFSYVPGLSVLESVDLTIRPHDAIGVVGPSGAGKSTLTDLILRLRRPSTGTITIGGVDVQDISPESWARLVAFVPQENKLIRASVADNIRFYRPGYSLEVVKAAARAAQVYDELAALPDGFETWIGPGERNLSGGQRQRLGIARAILSRPGLLVLDEPTSALDPRSEELIRTSLRGLRDLTTLVVVAHRPTTLESCTRIVQVSGGSIREVERLLPPI